MIGEMGIGFTVFSITVATLIGLLFLMSVMELLAAKKRSTEALYLVSRVGTKHGYPVREKPLSLIIPEGEGDAVLHYYLLAGGEGRDAIALKAERPATSRLGNIVIDNDPSRVFAAGMRRLVLAAPQFDPYFRIFTEVDRRDFVRTLLGGSGEFLFLVKDLACRSRAGHFELVDLSGKVKIQFDDHGLRFPSDVERITLDIVRLHRLYRALAGAGE